MKPPAPVTSIRRMSLSLLLFIEGVRNQFGATPRER